MISVSFGHAEKALCEILLHRFGKASRATQSGWPDYISDAYPSPRCFSPLRRLLSSRIGYAYNCGSWSSVSMLSLRIWAGRKPIFHSLYMIQLVVPYAGKPKKGENGPLYSFKTFWLQTICSTNWGKIAANMHTEYFSVFKAPHPRHVQQFTDLSLLIVEVINICCKTHYSIWDPWQPYDTKTFTRWRQMCKIGSRHWQPTFSTMDRNTDTPKLSQSWRKFCKEVANDMHKNVAIKRHLDYVFIHF